jgi:hypothetical protein
MKLPNEIDDLMWEVAEADTPELMDDFAARYPEHKAELLKRIKMVRQLKGARPKQKARAAFKPKPLPPPPRVSVSPVWAVLGALCLLVVGVFAGVGITSLFLPKPADSALNMPRNLDGNDGGALERSTWIPNPPPAAGNSQDGAGQTDPPPKKDPEPVAPIDSKITVINDRARLSQLLNEVAVKAGIRIQAAPGMPEMDVAVEYHDLSALAILNDLGRTCGFTPLRQTDSEALLIPTVDKQNPPRGVLGGSVGLEAQAGRETDDLPPTNALSGQIGR